MAQAPKRVYSGPVKTIEISDDDATYVDLGIVSGDAEINWVPTAQESSDRQQVQLFGIGTLTMNLLETGSTNETELESHYRVPVYFQITTLDGKVFKTILPAVFTMEIIRNDGDDAHMVKIVQSIATLEASDWIVSPTDA